MRKIEISVNFLISLLGLAIYHVAKNTSVHLILNVLASVNNSKDKFNMFKSSKILNYDYNFYNPQVPQCDSLNRFIYDATDRNNVFLFLIKEFEPIKIKTNTYNKLCRNYIDDFGDTLDKVKKKKNNQFNLNNNSRQTFNSKSSKLSSKIDNNNPCCQSKKRQLNFEFGDDMVAVVTGGARGIGRAIAETFALGGVSKVICVSKTNDSAEKTAHEINSMVQGDSDNIVAVGYGADVSNKDDVDAVCRDILEKYHKVDILVNNAGITKDNLFMRMTYDEWKNVLDTNLNSAFFFTKALIDKMIRNRYGRIVNISSVSGIGGNAGQSNYAASKAALIGFSKSLSKEVASRGITVNCVAPGFIHSNMTNVLSDDIKKSVISMIPANRFGNVHEVADLTAFLCTKNAAYINGKVVPIDGGMLFGSN